MSPRTLQTLQLQLTDLNMDKFGTKTTTNHKTHILSFPSRCSNQKRRNLVVGNGSFVSVSISVYLMKTQEPHLLRLDNNVSQTPQMLLGQQPAHSAEASGNRRCARCGI
ncbi:unnamed protein product [Pleuronectes platessa]|uniref:Uncharacterized protein n=1 Tax=Pleuronectes platessa TaxID=8262 RepID=A0A9N7U8C3_PLEPL|nr:unnamed protein product [Pleuronectes platessa]